MHCVEHTRTHACTYTKHETSLFIRTQLQGCVCVAVCEGDLDFGFDRGGGRGLLILLLLLFLVRLDWILSVLSLARS